MNLVTHEKKNEREGSRKGQPRRQFITFHEEPHDITVVCDWRDVEAWVTVRGHEGSGLAFDLPADFLSEAQAQETAEGFYKEWVRARARRVS